MEIINIKKTYFFYRKIISLFHKPLLIKRKKPYIFNTYSKLNYEQKNSK